VRPEINHILGVGLIVIALATTNALAIGALGNHRPTIPTVIAVGVGVVGVLRVRAYHHTIYPGGPIPGLS
jgi:hypothetical protein